MSADWSTVAVTTRDRTGDNARVSVLDTASLRPKGPVIDLRPEERNGAVALDATGSTLVLSWRRDVLSATASDIRNLSTSYTPEVSVWSLPDGARSGEHRTHSGEWRAAVPLGRGPDGPVAVLDNSTIGVALPAAGKPPPLRRLAQTDTRHHSVDDVLDRLCGLLADPNTDDAVRELVPDDAHQGKLCPS